MRYKTYKDKYNELVKLADERRQKLNDIRVQVVKMQGIVKDFEESKTYFSTESVRHNFIQPLKELLK